MEGPFKASLPGLLRNFAEAARQDPNYFLCDLAEAAEVASLIEHVDLGFADRCTHCLAPVALQSPAVVSYFKHYARAYANSPAPQRKADLLGGGAGRALGRPRRSALGAPALGQAGAAGPAQARVGRPGPLGPLGAATNGGKG